MYLKYLHHKITTCEIMQILVSQIQPFYNVCVEINNLIYMCIYKFVCIDFLILYMCVLKLTHKIIFVGYHVVFWQIYSVFNIPIRVSISISSNINHCFEVKTFKVIFQSFSRHIVHYCYSQKLHCVIEYQNLFLLTVSWHLLFYLVFGTQCGYWSF